MPVVLIARGLKKAYGDHLAVNDVSIEINRGESFGLLGPNGAGKSTTISMIVGGLAPDSGSVTIDGIPISQPGAKQKIGYVPQELALYDDISARDNLRFFGALYGVGGFDDALQIVGLTERQRDRVGTFSGGMKRRLNIAVALLHSPEIIILDEPTVGVDPQSRNAIFDALETLRSQGLTILYTTHYMEEVERLCSRIAVMDHGQIVAQGTLADLKNAPGAHRGVTIQLVTASAVDGLPPGVTQDGATLRIPGAPNPAELSHVLLALHDQHREIAGIETESTDLEDVFLQLTGRALRD